MSRLVRLSLFQFAVAMAIVLLNGTLNRVMIVELGTPSWLVGLMVSLPLLFAPFRALIGHKSDTHRSALGWRRAPFIWFGSMLQFGGLAIMPFALFLLSGDTHAGPWVGYTGAALAFLLVGAGLHTTQTAGLALATDIAPEESRPRVVAFLYVMLLAGMVLSSFVFGWLLTNFSQFRLIQVIQGAAVLTMILNVAALWKQEARDPNRLNNPEPDPSFFEALRSLQQQDSQFNRSLVVLALGTAAFSMQDILLEPYGGEILHMTVGQTTALTGLIACGTLIGFAISAYVLARNGGEYRLASLGGLAGLLAFPAVIFSASIHSAEVFRIGVFLIGLGGGLFSVSTLTAAMNTADPAKAGLALGAWGAIQASASGLAIATGSALRDAISHAAANGVFGATLADPATGYIAVYQIEIFLLFAMLVAVGPLAAPAAKREKRTLPRFGLAEFPG